MVWVRQAGLPLLITNQRAVINPVTGIVSQPVSVSLQDIFATPLYQSIAAFTDNRTLRFYGFSDFNGTLVSGFSLTARPAVGDGYLTGTNGTSFSPPGSIASTINVEDYSRARDADVTFVRGAAGPGSPNRAVYRFTENSGALIDDHINAKVRAANDGTGAAARYLNDPPGFGFAWKVYVINPTGNITLQYPDRFFEVNDMEFSEDGRYLLVLGTGLTTPVSSGLHVYRLP
jgi:hypothetical protein